MRALQKIALWATVSPALLGFLFRVVVPAGFMPAPPEQGWPVKLCPGHAAASPHAAPSSPEDPAGGPSEGDGAPIPCPLGTVFSSAAVVDTFDCFVSIELVAELTPPPPAFTSKSATACPRPRGPPSPVSHDTFPAG